MDPRLLSIDNNNYRCIKLCPCMIYKRSRYIKNFNININRHIGALFDSIEILCGLTKELIVTQSSIFQNIEDKCENIYSVVFLNGIKYLGNVSSGQFNGFGELFIEDKLFYTGEFKNNLFHGNGELHSNFCDHYKGEFFEGSANGEGKITWCNGNSYEGKIENNLPQGLGVYKLQNGSYYEGNFNLGKKSGHGKYISIQENGNIIKIKSEDWKNDLLNGSACIECDEQLYYYSGQIKSMCFNPLKIYILPYGLGVISNELGKNLYVGKFKNGLKHEIGNEYFENGIKKYRGCFHFGHYHGVGKCFNPFGEIKYEGDFFLGKKHGKGFISHDNGFEVANFKNDQKFGKSTFTNTDLKTNINYYHNDKIVSEKFIPSDDQEMCPICQDHFIKNDLVTNIPKCGHKFHSECLFLWLKNNDKCPMCRDTNLFAIEENPCKKRKLSQ